VMTKEAFERSLRVFSQRRPFKPFVVELASGARLTVDHPEALAHRGPAAVYVSPDGEYTLFDNTMVTQVSDVPANGSRRSRKQT
jgi:hypothetical protein